MRPLLIALAALALLPTAASAHATLEGSQPSRGAQIARAPDRVTLRFDESVEVAFGAVRVFDASGERVDTGPTRHPGGRGDEVGVRLRGGLGDGVYTATYRVISADSHPVSGGFVFTVGSGGAAPKLGVEQLLQGESTGPVTEAAFGFARGLSYICIALAVGGFVFMRGVWRPAAHAVGGEATAAFDTRARRLVVGAAAGGVLASALGVLLQGATAGGGSFWSALDPTVVDDVLGTRFGTVWGLRLLAFAALAVVLASGRWAFAAVAIGAFICLTPALAGHSSTLHPSALLVPANALHVSAMAIWVGGVALLALALPAATRRLTPTQRSALLAGTVGRFSGIAIWAVAALVASGVLQAIVELDAVHDLWQSAFGRAILIKSGLVVALVGIGAWNRTRARPRLARRAATGQSPGATGAALRSALRGELLLMAGVFAATAALASYAPPSAARGPYSTERNLGSARLQLTIDPAQAGPNEIHLYLFDRRSGAQFQRVKELDLSAALPDHRIGPLKLDAQKAGPGHWIVRRADLGPAGDWRLTLAARVSEFDEYTTKLEVPIK